MDLDRGPDPITPSVIAALCEAFENVATQVPILVPLDRLDDSWDGSEGSKSLLIGLIKAAKDLNVQLDRGLAAEKGIRVDCVKLVRLSLGRIAE